MPRKNLTKVAQREKAPANMLRRGKDIECAKSFGEEEK